MKLAITTISKKYICLLVQELNEEIIKLSNDVKNSKKWNCGCNEKDKNYSKVILLVIL